MDVSAALLARHSTRAFTDAPVERSLVEEILSLARRAPSGGNLQPWKLYVLAGARREELVSAVRARILEDPEAAIAGEAAEYRIYPPELPEPYRSRRARVAAQLYEALGIPKSDRAGRLRQLARNYEFFGAPVGIIVTIDRYMQPGQYVDLGLYMQSLALLAVERGLATCMQESWANWPDTVRTVLGISKLELVFCGISLGYPQASHPVNGVLTERAELAEFARIEGL